MREIEVADREIMQIAVQQEIQRSDESRYDRLFRAMGIRRRKPRPLIAKADPSAQKRYKKTTQTGQ